MVGAMGHRGWVVLFALGLGAAVGCGDDAPPASGDGSAGRGGAAGSVALAGRGGTAGRDGRNAGGRAGTAGQAGEAGEAGARPQAGEAGAPVGGGGPNRGGSGGSLHGEGGEAGDDTAGGSGGEAGGIDEPELTPIPVVDETGLPVPEARAGFIELAPVTYTSRLGGSMDSRTSTRVRLFYNLDPATEDAKSKPVFVVFNGGPGAASSLLRSFGTGPRTLDPEAPEAASTVNPTSLTSLGSLLYIDARHAGYSYALAEDASDSAERAAAFDGKSINEAIDAADFVRVVLRVLALEPSLRNNPIVIMGESYGGVRAPMMLYFLLHPGMLKDAESNYYDPALGDELAAHLGAVFQKPAAELGARSIAQQFGWQILLEPLAVGSYQFRDPGGVAAGMRTLLAQELGISESELAARCPADVRHTQAWCDALEGGIDRVSQDATEFQAFNGIAPSSVAQFPATQRGEAFRVIDAEADPLTDPLGLGVLPDWDRYYFPFTGASPTDQPFTFLQYPTTGLVFVVTAAYVETLITNAHYDTTVYPLSIVPALRKVVTEFPTLGLAEVGYVGDDPNEPSDAIRLRYAPSSFVPRGTERTIHFPPFPNSGHFVSVTEPARLYAEVEAFLAASGL
jgi:hypothetical protein